jgi:hypothetical protein
MRVMSDTFSLMTKPNPEQLTNLININRGIAAGLSANGTSLRRSPRAV